MPITYSDLYSKIISFENLYLAFQEAIKGRRTKLEVLAFCRRHEEKIMDMHKALKAGTWEPGGYIEFLARTEVKRRVIHAPIFRDRIVQMAIYRVLMPLFDNKFIYDSYACRQGKGTHSAKARTQTFLRRAARNYDSVYVLQGDISKYYPSIYKPYLMEKIARTIRDKQVLDLLEKIYYSFNDNDRGIPIGAATSQMAANVVLDTLDHFVKECLCLKYYVRYMDDFIIILDSKEKLKKVLEDVTWLISGTLKLSLNPKTQIYPASKGVDFVGYRIWATHVLPRKRDIKAAKLRFKDLSYKFRWNRINLDDVKPRVDSFLGYMQHCNGYESTKSTLKWLRLQRRHENENRLYQNH